jgi:tight adherence protein B
VILAILAILVQMLGFGLFVLYHDARERRVQRQLANALPERQVEIAARRRVPPRPRNAKLDRVLSTVFKYEANAPRKWPVSYVVLFSCAAAFGGLIISHLVFPLWVALLDAIVTACLTARMLFVWQQRRYADQLLRQLPDAVQLIVSAVRAGLPVSEAFKTVAKRMPNPTKQQFELVCSELDLSRAPEETLHSVYQRTHVDEYAMFSVTLAVQSRAGGGLAETLQTLGDTLRQRVALAGRAKALASEAKLSSRVLSGLPFIAAFLLYLERPDALNPLFYDPRGRVLLAIGATSLSMGILTMRHMIRKGTTV